MRVKSRIKNALKAASSPYQHKANREDQPITALIGCNFDELLLHIDPLLARFEDLRYHLSFEDFSTWELDHIQPISRFDLLCWEDCKKAFNYKNMQPLPKLLHAIKTSVENVPGEQYDHVHVVLVHTCSLSLSIARGSPLRGILVSERDYASHYCHRCVFTCHHWLHLQAVMTSWLVLHCRPYSISIVDPRPRRVLCWSFRLSPVSVLRFIEPAIGEGYIKGLRPLKLHSNIFKTPLTSIFFSSTSECENYICLSSPGHGTLNSCIQGPALPSLG